MNERDHDNAEERAVNRLYWQRAAAKMAAHQPFDPHSLYLACERDVLGRQQPSEFAGIKVLPVRLAVLETKDLHYKLAVKGGDDTDASVDGYLAVFNNTDLVQDVIHPGAFRKTLQESKAVAARNNTPAILPLLWQHDKLEPIGGIVAADEDRHGLFITCRINRDIERGRQAYDGLKNGYMSFSIGYKAVKYEYKGSTRHLLEIALGEGSAVTFPANPEARATNRTNRAA